MKTRTLIVKKSLFKETEQNGTSVIDYKALKKWCTSGKIFLKFRYYHNVIIHAEGVPDKRRVTLLGGIAYFLRKKSSTIKYNQKELKITFFFLFKRISILIRDFIIKPFFLYSFNRKLTKLYQNAVHSISLPSSGTPYYFRTDFHFDLIAGGSVGHIAGVLNTLEKRTGTAPVILTCIPIPTVKETIKCHIISHEDKFLGYTDLPRLAFSETYAKKGKYLLRKDQPQFIYERFSPGSISGVELSQHFQVPLILEYNGSEVWIAKNWGNPFHYEKFFLKVEELNLHAAQLIVVISRALKGELMQRGVDERKILINPNGVDPEKYSPAIEGSSIRKELKLDHKIAIGFIGTFGKWHGADVLVDCFAKLIAAYPHYREKVHLMMIGDGLTMPEVMEIIERNQLEDCTTLTGLIPQASAPKYLAACHILAAPHVHNRDGSKFFGSPTKLFEYMAMGRGIVASDLGQIGEILTHKKTAFLVEPGNKDAWMHGLKALIDDPKLCNTLGKKAREEVVQKYTWEIHTQKIIEELNKLCMN